MELGETGFDFFYNHSPEKEQREALEYQIDLALRHNLALIFHVREAFESFWEVFDNFKNVRGVVHSFSATRTELDQILERNLIVGLNGIMTFSKKVEQLDAMKKIPLKNMILETDAPFLTPIPHRGRVNSPEFLPLIAKFLAEQRGEDQKELEAQTTKNAEKLFNI